MPKPLPTDLIHYDLILPQGLCQDVAEVAIRRGISFLDLLGLFIKLGLQADAIEQDPNSDLIVREGNQERPLTL